MTTAPKICCWFYIMQVYSPLSKSKIPVKSLETCIYCCLPCWCWKYDFYELENGPSWALDAHTDDVAGLGMRYCSIASFFATPPLCFLLGFAAPWCLYFHVRAQHLYIVLSLFLLFSFIFLLNPCEWVCFIISFLDLYHLTASTKQH